MDKWLEVVIGACAFALTVGSLIFQSGRATGVDTQTLANLTSKMESLEKEVNALRMWRHDMDNFRGSVQALEMLTGEFKRMTGRK